MVESLVMAKLWVEGSVGRGGFVWIVGKECELERATAGQGHHFSVAGVNFWIAQCADTLAIDGPDSVSGCGYFIKILCSYHYTVI